MDISTQRLAILTMKKMFLDGVGSSDKDLASMTKAKIVEFGDSIGVTLKPTLTKAVMIDTLKATAEFIEDERVRKTTEQTNYVQHESR
tara:strand:- start:209 stop:472 length:264 start_codon:yes stop_codon:yes gene_type:complete